MRRALGITYITAHNALYYWNKEIAWKLGTLGYDVEVIDAAAEGGMQHLYQRLQNEDFEFCYGAQGVGSNLLIDDQNLWSVRRTPFIGIHVDNPCYNIFNHANLSPYVANLYCFESFYEIHKHYIQTSQVVDFIPYHTYSIPPEAPLKFEERPIKMLFMKSGATLDECHAAFKTLPANFKDGVADQLKRAEKDPNLNICDLVQEIYQSIQLDRRKDFANFWGITHWMDFYLRRKRAIDFVEWLKFQEGAVIIGDGWDFIDKTAAKAVFKPSLDGVESYKLYAQTQFICNTNPYGRDLIHERAVFGLFNNCCIISDTNQWWQSRFDEESAVRLFNWNQSLDDQIKPFVKDIAAASRVSEAERATAMKLFSNHPFTNKLIETAAAVRKLARSKEM